MVPEYYLWFNSMAERDQGLIMLFVSALILVGAWIMLELFPIPERIREVVKLLFALGGLPLYIISLFSFWIFGG